MKYLGIFIFSFCCLLGAAQSQEKPLSIPIPHGVLKGSLLLPKPTNNNTKKCPLVLIIAGSGPTDRNGNNTVMKNNSLKMLAQALAQNGIASLRYDKRGVGESQLDTLKEADLRFKDFIADAKAWISYLNKDSCFSGITVLGHSEGSLIGLLASQETNVIGFISIAGVGINAAAIIKEQLTSQPEFIQNLSKPILEKLTRGETVAEIPPFLYTHFRPSVQPYLISWFAYNPKKEIGLLKIPILILQGDSDLQVSVKQATLLQEGNPLAQKVIIKGMNHILKPVPLDRAKNIASYNNPTLEIHKSLGTEIAAFIAKIY